MTERWRDILWLNRGAGHVQDIEALRQAHEVAEVVECARAFAAFRVHRVRRAADGKEERVTSPDLQRTASRGQGEIRRCRGDRAHDHVRVKMHLRVVDHGPGFGEESPGAFVEHANADFLQRGQSGFVDHLDLIVRVSHAQRHRTGQLAIIAGALGALSVVPVTTCAAARSIDVFRHLGDPSSLAHPS